MPLSKIYTLGYARWTVDQVAVAARELDGVLADIRHSPYTSKPGFSKEELRQRFRNRYVHIAGFGNVNYKEGPVELADFEKGLHRVRQLKRVPILLCGCRSATRCHRSTVALKIAEQCTVSVHHLTAPGDQAQNDLFDSQTE